MKTQDLSHIENRYARIAERLTPAHRAGWKMTRRRDPMPANAEIVLRPDGVVLVRSYWMDDAGAPVCLSNNHEMTPTIDALEKVAEHRKLDPVLFTDWLEAANSEQVDYNHGEEGDLDFLELIAGPDEAGDDDYGPEVISEAEIDGLINALEKIIPVLRAEVAGEDTPEIHGTAAERAEMIRTLESASEILGNMAAVMAEEQ